MIEHLRNLHRAAVDIRLNGGLVEDGHGHLRIGGLRAELVIRIAEGLADRVDTNQSTRRQEVLALQRTSAHRVLLGPHRVRILGQKLRRSQLVTRVAARRSLRIAKPVSYTHLTLPTKRIV